MAKKPKPYPKSLGACADLLHDLKDARTAANKAAEEADQAVKRLEEHIINTLPKGDSGAVGRFYKAIVVRDVKPVVEDWDKFYAHVKRTGNFELMQKRLGEGAVNERWGLGKEVPGVGRFNVVKVSLTKV